MLSSCRQLAELTAVYHPNGPEQFRTSAAGTAKNLILTAPKAHLPAPHSTSDAQIAGKRPELLYASAGITRPRKIPIAPQSPAASPRSLDALPRSVQHTTPADASIAAVHPGSADKSAGKQRDLPIAASATQQARIKAWHDLLIYYRQNPATLAFSYLVLADPHAVVRRPYDLRIVPHSQLHREYYYTMSAQGMTFFRGDETSHIPLDDFEADFFKYEQIVRIKFFAQFRSMKALRIWRAFIARSKAKSAATSLRTRLFQTHACFGPCLRALVARCVELRAQPLLAVLQKDQPGDLQQLKARLSLRNSN